MSNLFGALDIKDSERPFTDIAGQRIIWDASQDLFQRYNMDLDMALGLFVEETTEDYKERYELPGGGRLQEERFQGNDTGDVRRGGTWDVAYPLKQYGASLSYNEVALGYLTMGQYERAVQTVINQNNNTVFNLVLSAVLNNAPSVFKDPIRGDLTLVPLANGDSVVYPPVYGSETEATETLYIGTSYAESAISNTNNPFVTIRDKFEPHYGFPQGGSHIIALVNTSTIQYARALAGFDEVPYYNVAPGDNVSVPQSLDTPQLAGARVVGVTDGVTIIEWPRCPTGVVIGLHMDAPKPLKRRRDPSDTGLNVGLQLTTRSLDHPYFTARWRHRTGFAVGNRLGAVAINLNGTGTYAVPTGFSN